MHACVQWREEERTMTIDCVRITIIEDNRKHKAVYRCIALDLANDILYNTQAFLYNYLYVIL